jgi:hypothetical protein
MMPQTKDAVCETLFVLCDKDGKCVKKWIGEGYKRKKKDRERERERERERLLIVKKKKKKILHITGLRAIQLR